MNHEVNEQSETGAKIQVINGTGKAGHGPSWKQDTLRILLSRQGLTVFGVLVAVVAGRMGLNWYLHRGERAAVSRVRVVPTETRTIDKTLSLPGNVEAIERASLYAHVSGYLRKLHVDEGDKVKKGQLLAEIDAPDIVQAFHKSKAEFDLKQVTLKRYDELLKEKVVSQQEYDTVKAEADEAKARFDDSAANVAYTRITAPFDGAIARRFKYPGDLITSANQSKGDNPIFILVNEERLRVSVNVPQSELASVREGFPVDVSIDAMPGRLFKGQISRLDALLDESTKTERVLIDLDNGDNALRAGMFATVLMHVEHKENVATLPKDAIRQEDGKEFVFTVREGKVHKLPMTTGASDGTYVEVQGIPAGEQIASGSAGELTEGLEVELLKESKARNGSSEKK